MKGGVTRESKAKNSCEDHEKFDRTHKLGQRDIKDETTIVCYQHYRLLQFLAGITAFAVTAVPLASCSSTDIAQQRRLAELIVLLWNERLHVPILSAFCRHHN